MEKRRFRLVLYFFLAVAILSMLTGCELFLGNGEAPNVTLDLGLMFGDGRSTVPPYGISFTGIVVTVYGEGMTTIQKTVSPGARFLNMYVPAGPDRRFKVEAFFNITNPNLFQFHHLRSYIGRATADLSPGRIVRLVFNMVAGSTMYLVPDYLRGVIHYSNDLYSFDPDSITLLNATPPFQPMDIEISDNGTVFAANYAADGNAINYAESYDSPTSPIPIPASGPVWALAMDRDAGVNINNDKVIDTSILYFTTVTQLFFTVVDSAPTTPQVMELEGKITVITGLAVDPWTHLLYIVGTCDGEQSIVVYDPFYSVVNPRGGYLYGRIVATRTDPRFRALFDITVTDTAVYVLNGNLSTDNVPSVMEFDRSLNFIRGFGSVSWNGSNIVASTQPGKFYIPLRFVAQESAGLSIIDDSNQADLTGKQDYDKIVHVNGDLDPSSWTTFPQVQEPDQITTDPFRFYFDIPR